MFYDNFKLVYINSKIIFQPQPRFGIIIGMTFECVELVLYQIIEVILINFYISVHRVWRSKNIRKDSETLYISAGHEL